MNVVIRCLPWLLKLHACLYGSEPVSLGSRTGGGCRNWGACARSFCRELEHLGGSFIQQGLTWRSSAPGRKWPGFLETARSGHQGSCVTLSPAGWQSSRRSHQQPVPKPEFSVRRALFWGRDEVFVTWEQAFQCLASWYHDLEVT